MAEGNGSDKPLNITADRKIEQLERLLELIEQDDKLNTEQRVKLTNAVISNQLRAGALVLNYRKLAARLPEHPGPMELTAKVAPVAVLPPAKPAH